MNESAFESLRQSLSEWISVPLTRDDVASLSTEHAAIKLCAEWALTPKVEAVDSRNFPAGQVRSKSWPSIAEAKRNANVLAEAISSGTAGTQSLVVKTLLASATAGMEHDGLDFGLHQNQYPGADYCDTCGASGKVHCPTCAGHGNQPCGCGSGRVLSTCWSCGGRGVTYNYGNQPITCSACGGTRSVWTVCGQCHGSGYVQCVRCGGAGAIRCDDCNGHGAHFVAYRVTITAKPKLTFRHPANLDPRVLAWLRAAAGSAKGRKSLMDTATVGNGEVIPTTNGAKAELALTLDVHHATVGDHKPVLVGSAPFVIDYDAVGVHLLNRTFGPLPDAVANGELRPLLRERALVSFLEADKKMAGDAMPPLESTVLSAEYCRDLRGRMAAIASEEHRRAKTRFWRTTGKGLLVATLGAFVALVLFSALVPGFRPGGFWTAEYASKITKAITPHDWALSGTQRWVWGVAFLLALVTTWAIKGRPRRGFRIIESAVWAVPGAYYGAFVVLSPPAHVSISALAHPAWELLDVRSLLIGVERTLTPASLVLAPALFAIAMMISGIVSRVRTRGALDRVGGRVFREWAALRTRL